MVKTKVFRWFQETLFEKGTSTDVSCEFCEIFKNTFLIEHLRVIASDHKPCTLIRIKIVFIFCDDICIRFF